MKKFLTLSILAICLFGLANHSSKADSPRMVLYEEFTNTSCGYCGLINPDLLTMMISNKDRVVPLFYHVSWPSSYDPFYLDNTTISNGRTNYYSVGSIGVPYGVVEGNFYQNNPYSVSPLSSIQKVISKGSTNIDMTVTMTGLGLTKTITVTIKSSKAVASKTLQVAIAEGFHYYTNTGGNGENYFYFLPKNMFPTYSGTSITLKANTQQTFTYTYTTSSEWHPLQLYAAAFIQDDATQEVLQAASTGFPDVQNATKRPPYTLLATTSNPYDKIGPGATVEKTITIRNTNSFATQAIVFLDSTNARMPSGWAFSLEHDRDTITIPAGVSVNLKFSVTAAAEASCLSIPLMVLPLNTTNGTPDYTIMNLCMTSSNAKKIFFTGTSYYEQLFYNSIAAYSDFSDIVIVPADAINYYTLSDFDFIFISADYSHNGYLSTSSTSIGTSLMANVKEMLTAGKQVLIFGDMELSNSEGTTGTSDAKELFANVLKIQANGSPVLRVTVNSYGNITGVTTYNCKGVADDPIGDGFDLTLNQYTSSFPNYIIYTDIISLKTGSQSKPIMYYDNTDTKIAGIRYEDNSSKGRLVYLTSGYEALGDNTTRNLLMYRILNWLQNKTVKGAEITLDSVSSSIDFGEVEINKTKTLYVNFTNTGDSTLKITKIAVPTKYSTIFKPTKTTATVAAGKTGAIPVVFSPTEVVKYTDIELTITSNADNYPSQIVKLTGTGKESSGAVIALDSTSITFGKVDLKKTTTKNLTIKNTGTSELDITNVIVESGYTDVFKPTIVNSAILAGKTGVVSVEFAPQAAKTYSNIKMTITSNATNAPSQVVSLTGIGNDASYVDEKGTARNGDVSLSAQPNPAIALTMIKYENNSIEQINLEIVIIDQSGREVANLLNESVYPGTHSLNYDVSKLSSGKYFILLKSRMGTTELPLVVTK